MWVDGIWITSPLLRWDEGANPGEPAFDLAWSRWYILVPYHDAAFYDRITHIGALPPHEAPWLPTGRRTGRFKNGGAGDNPFELY